MQDLEKGRAAPSQSTTFAFPQRRRKVIIVVLFLAALGLFVYASERSESTLSLGSWRWVKDSMRPISNQVQSQTSPLNTATVGSEDVVDDQPFQPTPALVSFADKMKTPLPTSTLHDPAKVDAPSHVDQMLLFLTAMKDAAYRVPELEMQRKAELQPSTTSDFVKTLAKVKADTADQNLVSDGFPL
jgi:hypothetical protein